MHRERRLGEILREDFGWLQATIDHAVHRQEADPAADRQRLGTYLRAAGKGRDGVTDIAAALVIQMAERGANQGRPPFATVEYRELGTLYRFDRSDMDAKIRSYTALIIGLVLYIAYPLNIALTQRPQLPEGAAGLLVLYALTGLFLVVLSMFLGDYTVKSYGQFLKRRMRIAKARIDLRAHHIAQGQLVPTAMPSRVPRHGERPDPEFVAMQRYLPLLYSAWCLIKLSFATYFLATLWGQGLLVKMDSVLRAMASVLLFAPLWIQIVGSTCERYHKYLKEGHALSATNLFPRASTDHLRPARQGHWWTKPAVLAYVMLGLTNGVLALVVVFAGEGEMVVVHGYQIQTGYAAMLGVAVLAVAYFAVRVFDVQMRVIQSKI